MDPDLNQEPMDSSALGLGSLLNDFETAHSRIEQRIIQLEAVAARSWHRHRWRQVHNCAADTGHETRNSADTANMGNEVQHHSFVGKGKGCKRDRAHLVAKALEMDLVVKKVDKNGGNFFDCNICFDIAKEPILTCCGHLYCWPCFYKLPYVDSTTKECPDCKGEVTDANITPVYGNSNSYCSNELRCGFELPPRPKANRVESVRQQRVTRGFSHIPVAETLRRIRTSIGLGDDPHQLETGGVSSTSVNGSQELQNTEATGRRRPRSRVFSRVLSESATSLSSELENAQRMFEDLQASLTDHIHERSDLQVSPIGHVAADEGNSFRREAVIIQSEHQTLDSIAETSSVASLLSSSQSDAALQLENLTTDSENLTTDSENLPVNRSPSTSRGRGGFLRLSDLDGELLRETRRRRLN